MTAATRSLILRALDEALALQVIQLVEVVNSDTSDEGIDRFGRGLAKAVNLHEQLVHTLSEETYDGV